MRSSQRLTENARDIDEVSGYSHPEYAQSLSEFGRPIALDASGAWLLERSVPGGVDVDAMGCYPLFSALNWQGLTNDLGVLGSRLISVALVADPFGDYTLDQLRTWFDRVVPFKEHFVADFSRPLSISKHHKYYTKRATVSLSIETGVVGEEFCDDWSGIYESLVRRHRLSGIKAFSRQAFQKQLRVPGMIAIRALESGTLVGAHLWYEQRGVAYSHLAAASERGYELNCSYAIYAAALEYFRTKVKRIDFGAGAGTALADDGLSRFKSGWSNSLQPALRSCSICGTGLSHALALIRTSFPALTRHAAA